VTKPVSVIFLVKDPPLDRLAALVEYMRQVADQFVIVVDDRTSGEDVDTMLTWDGVVIVPFKWRDDFSAARNAALPHVTRPWTLHLDPDELPSIPAMEYIAGVTDPANPDTSIAHVFWFFNWWGGRLGDVMPYHYHIRLWRTGHGKYYRKVHELVELDGKTEDQTRGNIAKMVLPQNYIIHSKPQVAIEKDQALYERLGERSL
jgi:hypothetical protein